MRSRDKLVASARATKASVEATFPEGGDVDEDGITDEERVQCASYIEVRQGVIEALGKLEEDQIGFFGGLQNVANTLGCSFGLVRRTAGTWTRRPQRAAAHAL